MNFPHEPNGLDRAMAVVDEARRAPFYAGRFEGLSEFRQLPFLEPADVREHAFPHSRDMLTRPLEGMILISTGGSTGVARITCFTHAEWNGFVEVQAQQLLQSGVRPDDRVANLFLAGHLWPSFLGLHDAVRVAGAVHLPISGNLPVPEIARLCQELEATVMLSLPTLFLFLADLGLKFPSLRLIGYVGEQMSRQAQDYVRRVMGDVKLSPAGYTSADCGLMGYVCSCTDFATYHLPTAFQYLEILDDNGEPCPPGVQGQVFVTNLGRTSMPIIRYRIGDLAAWTGAPCPCGDPNPTFTLAGRAGDDFKIGGGYISMVAFDETLAEFVPPLSYNYQVTLEDVGNQMDLNVCVESSGGGDVDAFRARLLERVPEFKKGLEMTFIRSLTVTTVELGSLPRNPITGKVKRLSDLRVV